MPLRMEFNAQQLEANIRQIGERAVKGMHLKAKKRAIKIRDLAREYAPVKTGLLERSIDYGTYKDAKRRNVYAVFIDLDALRESGNGELGDYAYVMEEELRPYGAGKYQLGFGSLLKKAAGGKKVGGRFLRRAVQEGSHALMDEMVLTVRNVTGARTASIDYQRSTPGNPDIDA
jgi:hypothetical protein